MPDPATLAAARPKCPKEVGEETCGDPLRLVDHGHKDGPIWQCPQHGAVLTPQALVARQKSDG